MLVLGMAREFRRPDWRRMLSGMGCTELREWSVFFCQRPMTDILTDLEFATLTANLVRLVDSSSTLTPADFRLLRDAGEEAFVPGDDIPERTDEMLMALAAGMAQGERFDNSRES